jgi:hypothetical protein
MVFDGATDEAMRRYRGLLEPPVIDYLAEPASDAVPRLLSLARDEPRGAQPVGEPLSLEIELEIPPAPPAGLNLLVELVGPDLWPVTGAGFWLGANSAGTRRLRCSLPTLRLAPSRYTVTVSLRDGDQEIESIAQVCPFEVTGVGLSVPAWTWRYVEDSTWSDGSLTGSIRGLPTEERDLGPGSGAS